MQEINSSDFVTVIYEIVLFCFILRTNMNNDYIRFIWTMDI